jgi:hypothetical protein
LTPVLVDAVLVSFPSMMLEKLVKSMAVIVNLCVGFQVCVCVLGSLSVRVSVLGNIIIYLLSSPGFTVICMSVENNPGWMIIDFHFNRAPQSQS